MLNGDHCKECFSRDAAGHIGLYMMKSWLKIALLTRVSTGIEQVCFRLYSIKELGIRLTALLFSPDRLNTLICLMSIFICKTKSVNHTVFCFTCQWEAKLILPDAAWRQDGRF